MKDQLKFKKMVLKVAICWGLFIGGAIVGSYTAQKKIEIKDPYLNQIISSWEIINKKYIIPVTPEMKENMLNGAISGMASSLDPHSEWYSKENAKKLNNLLKGQYGGIGVRFELTDNGAVIKEIKAESPADKLKLMPGDRILEVDGKKIDKTSLSPEIWQGSVGSPMKIKLKRKDSDRTEEYTITRANISGFEVTSEIKTLSNKENWLRIEIQDFQETTIEEVAFHIRNLWALAKNNNQNLTGIVLDLRGSPGGLVPTSAGLASLFLKEDQDIVNVNIAGKTVDTLKSVNFVNEPWSKWAKTAPIIIWDNKATASAAEILLSALREHDRVKFVLGDRTFGKGTVQNIYELKNGGQLKLSSAWYTTPKGNYIQGHGEIPDYEIQYPESIKEKISNYSENQLKGYLKAPSDNENNKQKIKDKLPITEDDMKDEGAVLNWYWKETDNILTK